MTTYRTADETPNELARYEAQKLAFAPLVFQAARAMRDLGVLRVLFREGAGGCTADEIAARGVEIPLYAIQLLLEAGYAAGLASHVYPRFYITKMGVYWLTDKLTRVNTEFSHHVCYKGVFHFEAAMRSGLPAGLRELGPWPTVYEGLASVTPEVRRAWFDFDHFYSDAVFDASLDVVFDRNVASLVDIGGNTGRFAELCLGRSDCGVAIVDLPGQVSLARSKLESWHASPRLAFHEMNLLDETTSLPPGADVYWMSQFLDCFSEAQIVSILRRVRAALAPGGRAIIVETFWDQQRYEASRHAVIATSLYFACIANGNSRMYDSRVMDGLIQTAGLRTAKVHDIGEFHSLVECEAARP
jgi:hypothetical protein